jgi:cellulose synthase/poly-beta-1,6-N-acetylglucosamine synthase-like glycosyltransferase
MTGMSFSMFTFLSWSIAFPLILALTVFSMEVLFGLRSTRRVDIHGTPPRTVILMPAHNEATNIGSTLDRLIAALSENARILVVADNCTDDTAKFARAKGVDVIERSSVNERGKGYALAFGRDHIKLTPPECVIVFDADCETDRQSLLELSIYCVDSGLPVQSQYTLKPDTSASPMVQISNFAFWVKNVVRQRGAARLGGSVILTGTGMAFPWRVIETMPLATSNVVEDLGMGIYLTQTGFGPLYLDQARVLSASASEQATIVQRSRWELGFIAMARRFGLKTIWLGLRRFDLKCLLLGLSLMVPPLASLIFVSFFGIVSLSLFSLISGSIWALVLLTLALCVATLSVFLAWQSGGKDWVSINTLWRSPEYIIWKFPIFLKFLTREKPDWNRTERKTPSELD